jgi:DNA-binding FadR family transcriptional regulator
LRRLTTDWAPGHPISEGGFNIDSAPFQRFAEICGNPFMAEMTSGLSAHVERVMNFALRQGSFVDEAYNRWRDAVFDAMEERAEKRASHAMVRLVGVGESELFRILQRTDSLLSIPLRAERAS